MSDLQLICLFQAGQISRSQLELSENSQLADVVELPLTLLRVYDLIESRLFEKVKTLHVLLANGIMDFLVAQNDKKSSDEKRNIEMQLFKNSVSPFANHDKEKSGQAVPNDTDYTGELK